MAMLTLEQLEERLGDPADFIVTAENRGDLAKWAIAKGYTSLAVHGMSNVALANLYHAQDTEGNPPDHQAVLADMFVKIVQSLSVPGFDARMIKTIVAEQLSDLDERIAQSVKELAPRRLEVITPRATTILEGPMHYETEKIIRIVANNHPVMMVGPAGCGKTTIGEHASQALQLPFYLTSTINETHELTGFVDGNGLYHGTPFRSAFEHGGVWIADEIDAWDASALLAANSALANGYSQFPDNPVPVRRNPDFRMIATANTYGSGADRVYIGRNQLDAASLDRFAMVRVDYDLTLEQMFSGGNQRWLEYVWKIRKTVNEKKIRHVVSSRAIKMGAEALNTGMNWNDVEEIYLFKGMSESDRSKI